MDNLKNQEIELMNQKIRDFEIILDENQNEHVESIKSMKMELDNLKLQKNEFEKVSDILNYFFKKMQTYYPKKNSQKSSMTDNDFYKKSNFFESNQDNINRFDLTEIQNKLIELENFIIKIQNEKSILNQKFSKVLEIQSKLAKNENFENSDYHIENVKKLNEKIFDLTEENNYLKNQLESKTETINISEEENLKKTDKENVFRNNFSKENNRSKSIHNEESIINVGDRSVITNIESKLNIGDNLRTLEQRVIELEKELIKSN